MLEIGSVLDGKYKILKEIGHGGMSVVYLALNERANKTWAVKEVRKDGGNDIEVVGQSLIGETEMLKKLRHPNLPDIVDVIDTDDTFIIVMDYIEGSSLQSLLDQSGAQPPGKVIEWSRQLCDVLGYLHSRQPAIIYRDMKPANVMLRPDGRVSLIDFGTAREYKEHDQDDTMLLGTRGYAAPEQFGGRGQTDARTDIYCLGATMHHLLTGISPADTQFVIKPIGQLVSAYAGSNLEKIVSKCCEPYPDNRYQSCAELMHALNHVSEKDAEVLRKKRRKRRRMIVGSLAGTLFLLATIVFSVVSFQHNDGEGKAVQPGAVNDSADPSGHYYEYVIKNCYWEDAYNDAKSAGGYLARIETSDEFDRIVHEIQGKGLTRYCFYLGGRRAMGELSYYWVDSDNRFIGEAINNPNSQLLEKWGEGEPSFEWDGKAEQYLVLDYYEDVNRWILNDVGVRLNNEWGYIIEWDSLEEYKEGWEKRIASLESYEQPISSTEVQTNNESVVSDTNGDERGAGNESNTKEQIVSGGGQSSGGGNNTGNESGSGSGSSDKGGNASGGENNSGNGRDYNDNPEDGLVNNW